MDKHIQSYRLGCKSVLSLALSIHPKVLLLDEPMIGIDPVDKQMMFEQIQGYMEDETNTLVISLAIMSKTLNGSRITSRS